MFSNFERGSFIVRPIAGILLVLVVACSTAPDGTRSASLASLAQAATSKAPDKRVTICHEGQTISIAQEAISAHLRHGDQLDACPSPCTAETCDDFDLCTSDACNSDGTCSHAPSVCDDGDKCTADSCDPTLGCVSAPLTGVACDDGNECTSNDTCQAGRCNGSPVAGCCSSDSACSDGNACTQESCVNHACVTQALVCDILDRCLAGFCDPTTGTCSSTPVSCSDDDPCTTDSCDPSVGCTHAPAADGTSCGDARVCVSGACQTIDYCSPNPCQNQGVCLQGDPADWPLVEASLAQTIDFTVDSFTCVCPLSWFGPTCETYYTDIADRCNNRDDDGNGTCDDSFPHVALTQENGCTPRAAETCTIGLGRCANTGKYVCEPVAQVHELCSVHSCTQGTGNLSRSGTTMVLTVTAGVFVPDDNGKIVTILSGANAGDFVLTFVDANHVMFMNPSGVAELNVSWSEFCSLPETPGSCNGIDDDCNGVVDDCVPGIAGSCCTP